MKKLSFTPNEKITFKRLGVNVVVLFGSQAVGTARDSSDFDLGILTSMPYNPEGRSKIYDDLYEIFSRQIGELRDIDIVFLQAAPAELQMHAVKNGRLLYEQTPGTFANFKAKTILEYADFAPLREIFHGGIFSRIK